MSELRELRELLLLKAGPLAKNQARFVQVVDDCIEEIQSGLNRKFLRRLEIECLPRPLRRALGR